MIYQNESVRVVPFEREKHMTEKYRSWFHDRLTTQYNSWGLFPYTPGQMEQFVKDIEQGTRERIVWAIEVKIQEDSQYTQEIWEHVGNCSLQSLNFINDSAEFAIVIGEKSARGKGFGEVVLRFLLNHGFKKLGLHRVWTGTAVTNVAMCRVAEKVGMKQEGVFREGMFLDGQFVDVVAYGILVHEWEEKIGKDI